MNLIGPPRSQNRLAAPHGGARASLGRPGGGTARLDIIFALLIAATGVTWWLGEAGAAGPAAVATILALAFAKGWLVLREFMALRRAPQLWTALVGGWLAAVLAVIAATYWKGLQ